MFKGLFLDSLSWATAANPNLVSDFTVVVDLWKEDWNPVATEDFVTVYESAGNERSWRFGLNGSGDLQFVFSTDGTDANLFFLTTPIPSFLESNEPVALKIEIDVDPGNVTFYSAPDRNSTFVQFAQVSHSGIITLNASTADLVVGARGLAGVGPDGSPLGNSTIKAVELYSDISTTLVVNAQFENEIRGTTSFTDDTANVWTLSDNAVIVDGQTPEMGLWLPDPTDVAKDWAVTTELSRLNAQAIDTFVGDLAFNKQDAVFRDINNGSPINANNIQEVKWIEINGIVLAWWDILFGSNPTNLSTGFIEVDLPVTADTTFHTPGASRFDSDLLGEGKLFRSQTNTDRVLCSTHLRSSTRIRIALDTGFQRDLNGDDPWTPDNLDGWNFNAIYKAAS